MACWEGGEPTRWEIGESVALRTMDWLRGGKEFWLWNCYTVEQMNQLMLPRPRGFRKWLPWARRSVVVDLEHRTDDIFSITKLLSRMESRKPWRVEKRGARLIFWFRSMDDAMMMQFLL